MGSPDWVRPQGTLMPGMPAKLVDRVNTSTRYMVRGSSSFSPILNAGMGETGVMRKSTSSNTLLNCFTIKVLTWHALR